MKDEEDGSWQNSALGKGYKDEDKGFKENNFINTVCTFWDWTVIKIPKRLR